MNSRTIITTLTVGVGFAIVDYRLAAGSDAIGAGNLAEAHLFDYRGLPRPLGPGLDIGAYEFSGWRLETTGVSRSAPGELAFDFFSTFGEWDWSYKVEVSDDLTAGVWRPLPDAEVTKQGKGRDRIILPMDEGNRGFFRIALPVAP